MTDQQDNDGPEHPTILWQIEHQLLAIELEIARPRIDGSIDLDAIELRINTIREILAQIGTP